MHDFVIDVFVEGFKDALKAIRRHKAEMDEGESATAMESAGIDTDLLDWEYDEVDRELEMLIAEKLAGSEPKAVAESAGESGFEIYRRLTLEFDPIKSNTPGLFMAHLAAMVKSQAKDPRDLKNTLRELESRIRLVKDRV